MFSIYTHCAYHIDKLCSEFKIEKTVEFLEIL